MNLRGHLVAIGIGAGLLAILVGLLTLLVRVIIQLPLLGVGLDCVLFLGGLGWTVGTALIDRDHGVWPRIGQRFRKEDA